MKQLFRKAPCGHCEAYIEDGKRGIGCIGCNETGYVYRPVDPADLELGYYGLVQELKKQINKPILGRPDELNDGDLGFLEGLHDVQRKIDDLESGLDPEKLKAMQKVRVQARAWDMLYEETEPDNEDMPHSLDYLLAQARADLKTPAEKGNKDE